LMNIKGFFEGRVVREEDDYRVDATFKLG
jgi:hypothetical protein